MRRLILIIAIAIVTNVATYAQESNRQLNNPKLKDLQGSTTSIPSWGRKHIVIFYVDPDRAGMNKQFTDDIEQRQSVDSPKILPIGVINLKDSPKIPIKLAYAIAKTRSEESGTTMLIDDSQILSSEWALGDCNNQFVLIVVNPAGEMIFLRKGVLTEADKEAFHAVVASIKDGAQPTSVIKPSTSL